MQDFVNSRMRENAVRIELYNDGDVIFLYDSSFQGSLRETEAVKVLLEDVEDRAKRLKALEASGQIAAYELLQDDSRRIELAVGAPLTTKEKKHASWFKAQKTVLRVPSGKLRIESTNSLTIGEGEPTEEGATVDIPSGDYLLTLERVNWEAMNEDHTDRPDLPTEFISLLPLDQAKPQKAKPFLSWGGVVGEKARWESEWVVKQGAFLGKAKTTWSNELAINLTPAAAQKLGAKVGSVLHLAGEGVATDFVYYGIRTSHGIERAFGKDLLESSKRAAPFVSSPQPAETPGTTLITLEGPEAGELPKFAEPAPVTIFSTGRVVLPLSDHGLVADIHIEQDRVLGRVLSCSKRYLNVNVTPEHLFKIGYKPGEPIQLTVNGDSREVFIENEESKHRILQAKAQFESEPDKVGLSGKVLSHWEVRGREIWDLTPVSGTELLLDAKAGDIVEIRIRS